MIYDIERGQVNDSIIAELNFQVQNQDSIQKHLSGIVGQYKEQFTSCLQSYAAIETEALRLKKKSEKQGKWIKRLTILGAILSAGIYFK
ncbi:MAG: hypothetical protein DWQ44_09050 [Bacteroidetes bacterium]|nr:MAG: hypothetical protein DWQ33_02725 [Bacteroidota bacterium]REK06437.1 MAG: hypothetical protein DWQ39_02840 [Bacteroidota bacterium]REK33203.1 MAG: hypothetical protein DWQ44_09050 [Bacteroidota bacterium]REK47040.1 MAG: hypothetical protein DWQ48_13385 [Bacteroidota bacterium]